MCPVKICVHHELALTFHDRCVKCVCPTAALVAESRAFRLVKSRTPFKLAHTLTIWCKTETWKCQPELDLGSIYSKILHPNSVPPPALVLVHSHWLYQWITCAMKCYNNWFIGWESLQKLWDVSDVMVNECFRCSLIPRLSLCAIFVLQVTEGWAEPENKADVPLTFLKFLGVCRSLLLSQLDRHSIFV